MKPEEQDRLEAALRQISPAAPPDDLLERLRSQTIAAPRLVEPPRRRAGWFAGWRRLAVLAPAAAMILLWLTVRPANQPDKAASPASGGIKTEAVQVDHSLVASFDAVAQVQGEEPIRFRCREWQDDVLIKDNVHGVVISKSTPRVEVVPVRFEVY